MSLNDFLGTWVLGTIGETAQQLFPDDSYLLTVSATLVPATVEVQVGQSGEDPLFTAAGLFTPLLERIIAAPELDSTTYYLEMNLAQQLDLGEATILYGVAYPVSGSSESDDGADGGWSGERQVP
jgi:hypothetical protein